MSGTSRWVTKTSRSRNERYDQKRAFQHWLRDNQVYFITACCREHFPAFALDRAKHVFWERFDH